jgi:hypothetical protein
MPQWHLRLSVWLHALCVHKLRHGGHIGLCQFWKCSVLSKYPSEARGCASLKIKITDNQENE